MATKLSDVIQRGTHAARPAASLAGIQYFESDTGLLLRDNGSSWDSMSLANLVTAKGDLLAATGAGAVARLGVGTDGLPLVADSSQASGLNYGNIIGGTAFAPSGLTGSVAASRYVGATASGAPASGAHLLGDWVTTQDAKVWVCTTAGTPGTWTQVQSPAMVASGGSHAAGLAPDPGSSAGTTKFLREDATWQTVSSGAVTQIAQTVLGSAAASITFSSIAGTYSALQLVLQARGDVAATNTVLRLQLNSDTGANYDWERDQVSGASGTTSSSEGEADTAASVSIFAGSTSAANVADVAVLWIPNYAGTTFQKTLTAQGTLKLGTSAGNLLIIGGAGWWRSTAAVTAIKIFPTSGNFVTGTVATLYGLS